MYTGHCALVLIVFAVTELLCDFLLRNTPWSPAGIESECAYPTIVPYSFCVISKMFPLMVLCVDASLATPYGWVPFILNVLFSIVL